MNLPKIAGPYNSLQEIKDKLRDGMEQALKREIEDIHKDTIMKRLVETHHFDLPETLVERELEAIIRQHMQQQQRVAPRNRPPRRISQAFDRNIWTKRHAV